jgi:hypothetical protein
MVIRDREGKYPPPDALAELLYHWMRTWPGAAIGQPEVDELYPYIVQKWREGWSLLEIAQTACSCDGRKISPSPAAIRAVPRKLVKPPEGAKPGVPFGADEVRDVESVLRLRVKAQVAELAVERILSDVQILDARLKIATGKAKERLLEQKNQRLAQHEAKQEVARGLKRQIEQLEETGKARAKQPATEAAQSRPSAKAAEKPKASKASKASKSPAPKKAPAAPSPQRPVAAAKPADADADADIENAIADIYKDD